MTTGTLRRMVWNTTHLRACLNFSAARLIMMLVTPCATLTSPLAANFAEAEICGEDIHETEEGMVHEGRRMRERQRRHVIGGLHPTLLPMVISELRQRGELLVTSGMTGHRLSPDQMAPLNC